MRRARPGRFLAALARQVCASGEPIPRPACLIAGGETTVTLTGSGRGGRNQELALGAVADLAGLEDVFLVALATDGGDGPTDAAGAVATGRDRRARCPSGPATPPVLWPITMLTRSSMRWVTCSSRVPPAPMSTIYACSLFSEERSMYRIAQTLIQTNFPIDRF